MESSEFQRLLTKAEEAADKAVQVASYDYTTNAKGEAAHAIAKAAEVYAQIAALRK